MHRAHFFLGTGAAMWAFWLYASVAIGRDFHTVHNPRVLTRPSWLPARALLRLNSHRYFMCHAVPFVYMFGSLFSENMVARLLIASFASAYHIAESCISHSHRDYMTLYCTWSVALLPVDWARAASLGFTCFLYTSAGLAKYSISGTDWMRPSTLRGILQRPLQPGWDPLCPSLLRLVLRSRILSSIIAAATLVGECGFMVAAMFMQGRAFCLTALVVFHVAIALIQSRIIGAAFLPALVAHAFGLRGDTPVWSIHWFFAFLVAAPALLPLHRKRLGHEDWPWTPNALFPFSASNMAKLLRRVEDGSGNGGIALARYKGAPDAYPAWDQIVGDTRVHDETFLRQLLTDEWRRQECMEQLNIWLSHDHLILESGQALRHAFWLEHTP